MKTVVYLDDSGVPTGYAEFQGPITDSEFESGTVFDDGLPDSFENIVSKWRVKEGVFQYVGSAPSAFCDWTESGWVFNVEKARAAKRSEIKRTRDALEFGGFTWNGHRFDSDQISQQRLTQACQQALQAKLTNQEFSRKWTLSNGEILENITADQMLDICRTLADYVNSLHTRSQELYRQIGLAETKEQLEQIVW